MSYDPTAHLIVGFEADEAFKLATEPRTVKKFDENTGEPYELEVEDCFMELPDGKRVSVEDPEEAGDFDEFEFEDLMEGLETFYTGDSVAYIGLELGRIETNWCERHNTAHTVADINLKIQALQETLKSLGWKKDRIPAIAVHLVM